MAEPFEVGSTVVKREVWDGRPWLESPVRVVADEGDGPGAVLAVALEPGSRFTFHDHPGGPHPWSAHAAWSGPTVLQLRRPGEWFSPWLFLDPGPAGWEPRFWYLNIERPVERTAAGIDTDDLELDLVVHPDGRREWKDVEHLAARLDERRMSPADLRVVLETAADLSRLLDAGDPWWEAWGDWRPEG